MPDDYGLDTPAPFEGVVFGFDFGTKRIGLAVGQTTTCTASPLQTLIAKAGVPDWAQLTQLITRWQPRALVIGIPLNMDGTTQPMTDAAKQFAYQLKAQFHLPVYGVDERLTSFAARQALFDQGGYKLLKKQAIDSFAAQLILESWLQHCAVR